MDKEAIEKLIDDKISYQMARQAHTPADGLQINPRDLIGFTPIPSTSKLYLNPSNHGAVTTLVINAPGTGYVVGDIVNIPGGSNNSAAAMVNSIGGGGSVTSIGILRGASGYTQTPNVSAIGGTGTGLKLDVYSNGYEPGYGSPSILYPANTTNGTQFIYSYQTSQYPIPIIVGSGRASGKPQGEFQGGFSPNGTLVAFFNGSTVDLQLRYDGRWYGVEMPDVQ